MIGKTIGEGDLDRAKLQVKTFNVVSMCAALCSIVILLAINPILISLYNIAPETVEMAKQMCFFNALFQIAYAFEMLYVCGLLVGSGDTNYIFWYTTIIMWGITMPIAFAGAFLFKWSPIVVFIILKCDYAIKGVVGYIRTKGTKWIKEVTVSK
jgi:Na+-driven multidrug efflux pump